MAGVKLLYTALRWRKHANQPSYTVIWFSGSLSRYAGYLKTWLQRSYSELQLRMLLRWLALPHYRYDLRLTLRF